jgi:ankyrin repeat protein
MAMHAADAINAVGDAAGAAAGADQLAVERAQIHYAVEQDDERLLCEICSRVPAAFDLSDDSGWAVLHWCSRYGRVALALSALQGGAAPNSRTVVDEHTPLHVAAMEGHLDVVLTLLHFSADVTARDTEQRTALHWAAVAGHALLVSPLVRAAETHTGAGGGANALRDAVDSVGRVALHLAAAAGHELMTAALMEVGAEPELPQQRDKRTALHLAAAEGHTATVECLLGCGALAEAVDSRGKTPLQLATEAEEYGSCVLLARAEAVPCPLRAPDPAPAPAPDLTAQEALADAQMTSDGDSDLDLPVEDDLQEGDQLLVKEAPAPPRVTSRRRVAVPSDSDEEDEA